MFLEKINQFITYQVCTEKADSKNSIRRVVTNNYSKQLGFTKQK